MRSRLRLTNTGDQETPSVDTPESLTNSDASPSSTVGAKPLPQAPPLPPAPFSFAEAHRSHQMGFPFCQTDHLCDEVLRTVDTLSTTLEDLRSEMDEFDDDDGPPSAA